MSRRVAPPPVPDRPSLDSVLDPALLAQVLPSATLPGWQRDGSPGDRTRWVAERLDRAPAGARAAWGEVLWEALALARHPVPGRVDTHPLSVRRQRMMLLGALVALVPWDAARFVRAIREVDTPSSDREWYAFGSVLEASLDATTAPAVGQMLADVLTRTGAERLPLKVREAMKTCVEQRGRRLATRLGLPAALAARANQQPVWASTAPLTREEARELAGLYTVTGHTMTEGEALTLAARCVLTSDYAEVLAREIWRRGRDRSWRVAHRLLEANRHEAATLAAYLGVLPSILGHGSPGLDASWIRAIVAAVAALPTPPAGEIATQMGDRLLPLLCTEGFWVCGEREGYDLLARWSRTFPASWAEGDGADALLEWMRRLLDRATPPPPLPSALLEALLQHPSAELRHLVLVGLLPTETPAVRPSTVTAGPGADQAPRY